MINNKELNRKIIYLIIGLVCGFGNLMFTIAAFTLFNLLGTICGFYLVWRGIVIEVE